jgi:hypothetical protein
LQICWLKRVCRLARLYISQIKNIKISNNYITGHVVHMLLIVCPSPVA